jgi:hypothetical protein
VAKIHYPHFTLFDFIVKWDNAIVFVEGDIEQPFHDGGFAHFTARQDGGTLGFFFFDFVNPFKEISHFLISAGKKVRFADSFF